jgi:hypothetical protein
VQQAFKEQVGLGLRVLVVHPGPAVQLELVVRLELLELLGLEVLQDQQAFKGLAGLELLELVVRLERLGLLD